MCPTAPALRHPTAGALEPTRLFIRYRPLSHGAAQGFGDGERVEAALRSGETAAGPFRLRLGIAGGADCATWTVRVQNAGAPPVRID